MSRNSYRRGKSHTVEGRVFVSAKEACEHYGVSTHNFHSRINAGWTVEQALELEDRPRTSGAKPVTVEGVAFESLHAATEHYGKPYPQVAQRIKFGWSVEEAMEFVEREQRRGRKGNSVVVAGVEYPSLSEAARRNGVTWNALKARLNRYGWTLEQALGLEPPPSNKCHPLEIGHQHFGSIREACDAYGVTRGQISARLAAGETPERAVQPGDRRHRSITVKGVEYPSLTAACRDHGLNVPMVWDRLKRGWTPDEAFNVVSRK